MPIISQAQQEKEKEAEVKRKRNAKRFAAVWAAGLTVSACIFFVNSDLGILLAVVSASIPSAINLLDMELPKTSYFFLELLSKSIIVM